MSVAARLLAAATKLLGLDLAGLSISYKRGASTATITARVGVLSNSVKYVWFTSTETSTWSAPAYTIRVAGDFQPFTSEPTTSDYVLLANYAGTSVQYNVMRWNKPKIGGVVMYTDLFVEKN